MASVLISWAPGNTSSALVWLPLSTSIKFSRKYGYKQQTKHLLVKSQKFLNELLFYDQVIEKDTHCFYQVIVWDLRKEMVDHVSSNIVMDVINPAVVTIKSGQPSPQVTPFLNIREKKSYLAGMAKKNILKRTFMDSRHPCLHRNAQQDMTADHIGNRQLWIPKSKSISNVLPKKCLLKCTPKHMRCPILCAKNLISSLMENTH